MSKKPAKKQNGSGKGAKPAARPIRAKSESAPSKTVEATPDLDNLGELPTGYQEMFLIARDPHWLYTYWDFDYSSFPAQRQLLLQVFAGDTLEKTIEINEIARNWYVPVDRADTDYRVLFGLRDQENPWREIGGAGPAHTPPESVSVNWDSEYATLPFHLSFNFLLEVIEAAKVSGEPLAEALGRLQQAAASSPGNAWGVDQVKLLEALLGKDLITRLSSSSLGSSEVSSLLHEELYQKADSASASELLARGRLADLLGAGESSYFSASVRELISKEIASGGLSSFGQQEKAFSSEQVASWSSGAVGLSSGESGISSLSSGEVGGLSSAETAGLSSAESAGLSSAQFGGVSSAEFAGPSSAQFGGVSSAEFGGLSSAEFGGVSSAEFGGLSSAEFGGLSSAGLGGLSSAEIGGLSSLEYGALGLSSLELSSQALSSREVGSFGLTPLELGALGLSSLELSSAGMSSWSGLEFSVSSWNQLASESSLFSGIGSSWSGPAFGVPGREFFMHVNAEVIFYGGTDPRAKVTIGGKPIQLQPDGTFRYHFKFPDSDFEVPIVAVSPDGKETRSAVLFFRRGTERSGDVGATAQPVELTLPPGVA